MKLFKVAEVAAFPNGINWADVTVETLHSSNQPNPLYILITGDGFTKTADKRDYNILKQFALNLTNRFLQIPPYNYCKDYIHILFAFIPSPARGVSKTSTNTAFKLYLTNSNKLRSHDRDNIAAILMQVPFPADCIVPPWLQRTSEDVWFNVRSRSFGAVCVVAYTYEDVPSYNAWELDSSSSPDSIPFVTYIPAWRYFVMAMKGYFNAENTGTDGHGVQTELGGSYAHSFAHELAHSLKLADEYETEANLPPDESVEKIRPQQNVMRIPYTMDLEGSVTLPPGEEILSRLKWVDLLSSNDRKNLENLTSVYSKRDLKDKGVILDQYAVDRHVYVKIPGTVKNVHWDQFYLVEGGALYSRGFFRSNFECKMRHFIFSDRTAMPGDSQNFKRVVNGNEEYGSPAFCHVCNFRMRFHVTGWTKYGVGTPKRSEMLALFNNELMPRLRLTFDWENRDLEKTGMDALTTNGPFCAPASVRLYTMLNQKGMDAEFIINTKHVFIIFRGILLDPVFYDWYRLLGVPQSDPQQFLYTSRDGVNGAFSEEQSKQGYIGDYDEYIGFFYGYNPRPNTKAGGLLAGHQSWGWNEKIDFLYKKLVKWIGPASDPDRKKLILPDDYHEAQLVQDFAENISRFWTDDWADYWKTRKEKVPNRSYFRPLELDIPMSDLQGGGP